MDSVNVEDIYKAYEIIDRAGDYNEVKKSYKTIISGAHGESNCKRLAAQFIPRFFGKFPEFHEMAIDALFDLCEDTDLNVRLTVIKYLPNVVKESDKVAVRIADALVQLLQNEIAAVKKALEQVIRLSPRDSIVAIFQQSLKGSPEVRHRTINFLSNDLNRFKEELFEKGDDVETCFANEELMKPVKARHFTKIVHSWSTSQSNVVVAPPSTPVKRTADADSSTETLTNKKRMIEILRSQM
ncbi:2799_t:CDS:2, partial [Racocetra fulgida]